jgi:signal transduction histidine kinase
MGALISNVLALSRIGREDGAPEQVALDEVADSVLERLAERIGARGVKVTRGALGEVHAVRSQMEQVLGQLIGNAVTYLGTQAEPQVEIGRRERDGAVEYFVRDNGIGMDAAYHAKVFEPFQRLKDVDAEGSGVGLTIVKKIVESVGGHVGVESSPGAGATFFFTWPNRA